MNPNKNRDRNNAILANAYDVAGITHGELEYAQLADDNRACQLINLLVQAVADAESQHEDFRFKLRRLSLKLEAYEQIFIEQEQAVSTLKRTVEDHARALGIFAV